jgi:hypothetical protein
MLKCCWQSCFKLYWVGMHMRRILLPARGIWISRRAGNISYKASQLGEKLGKPTSETQQKLPLVSAACPAADPTSATEPAQPPALHHTDRSSLASYHKIPATAQRCSAPSCIPNTRDTDLRILKRKKIIHHIFQAIFTPTRRHKFHLPKFWPTRTIRSPSRPEWRTTSSVPTEPRYDGVVQEIDARILQVACTLRR